MGRLRRAFAVSVALSCGLFGCELIVSSAVPDFRCTPGDPAACPSTMACDPTALVCVDSALVEAGTTEGGTLPDGNVKEGGTGDENTSSLAAIGAKCTADTSCQPGLMCGTSNTLTTAVVASTDDAVCTKTCCTSADCPADFVCFGPGTGGNYCISTARAQRGGVGASNPGESCTDGTDCRSGVCDETSHCLDTCCAANDCAVGTTCRVKSISDPSPAIENWVCAPSDTGSSLDDGATCSGTTKTCKNANCSGFPVKCRPPCCSSKQCTDLGSGFGICAYGEFITTSAQTKWCFDKVDGGAGAGLGVTCSGNADCASRFCDPDHKICAAVCCEDSDCNAGESCKPSASGTPFLRCVQAATVQ